MSPQSTEVFVNFLGNAISFVLDWLELPLHFLPGQGSFRENASDLFRHPLATLLESIDSFSCCIFDTASSFVRSILKTIGPLFESSTNAFETSPQIHPWEVLLDVKLKGCHLTSDAVLSSHGVCLQFSKSCDGLTKYFGLICQGCDGSLDNVVPDVNIHAWEIRFSLVLGS